MKVAIVSVTAPRVEGVDHAEDLVVYCARVSSPANQADLETAPRLLKYLVDHRHWSPFEMVSACVEIETSRAVAQQILRHRSFSFQEFSQRYADAPADFEYCDARRQGSKNRQSSTDDLPQDDRDWFESVQAHAFSWSQGIYREALRRGVAREQARMVLPLATRTRLYMSGTIRSWIHYLQARLDPATQEEHRVVAVAVRDVLAPQFPVTFEALSL